MPAISYPNLGLKAGYDEHEGGWAADMTANIQTLSVLVQAGVIDKVSATPGSPAVNDLYLFDSDHPTNPNAVAAYIASGWLYWTPNEGWFVYNKTENYFEIFDGAIWSELRTAGGDVNEAPIDGRTYVRKDAGWVEINPPAENAHPYWRILITANQGNGYTGIAELAFTDTPGGVTLTEGGTAIASGGLPDQAFNGLPSGGNASSRWEQNGSSGRWVGYHFTEPVAVYEARIMASAEATAQAPKDISFQYSDNGTDWFTEWTVADIPAWPSDNSYRTYVNPYATDQSFVREAPEDGTAYARQDASWVALGDAAKKNTGTIAGTVAAGNDSRIVGAYQTPTGTTSQYIRGDGSLASFPSIPGGTVTSVSATGSNGLTLSVTNPTTTPAITLGGTLSVAGGGTGAVSLTGYLKGNGTSAFTASATIPNTDITGLGTMSTQNADAVAITGGDIANTYFSSTAAGGVFSPIQTTVINIGTPGAVSSLGGIYLSGSLLGTPTLGDLSTGIAFGRKGTGRRGALIAGEHNGTDVNQMGLAFFCKSNTTTGNSTVVKRLTIDYVGHTYPGADNGQTLGSTTMRWSTAYMTAIKNGQSNTIAFGGLADPSYAQHHTGGSNASSAMTRWAANASGPQRILGKSRGTAVATYAALSSGDILGDDQYWGDNGTAMAIGAQIRAQTTETWSGTANGTRLTFSVVALATTTLTEVARFESATGLSMFGANPVVDANRIFNNRSYTVGTLPSLVVGGTISASDLGGGAGLLEGMSVGWMRTGDGGYVAANTDAGATGTDTYRSAGRSVNLTVPITALRTRTLTDGAPAGARIRYTRDVAATGASAWRIATSGGTTLKDLAAGTWCEAESNGTTWKLMEYGTL